MIAVPEAESALQAAPIPMEDEVVSQSHHEIENDETDERNTLQGSSTKERDMETQHAAHTGGWTLDPEKVATQTVLVLGGGAPNSTLMAGTLCAFEKKKIKFDMVYTSGAGAVMGLLYTAPNGSNPYDALRGTVDLMGVADSIYRVFPESYCDKWILPNEFLKKYVNSPGF